LGPGRTTDNDTAELAARLRDGDTRALEALYDRVSRRAFALAYRVLGDGTTAEDAVQEGFIAFWRQAGRIDPTRGNVESLLMTIVYRRAIDLVRARRGQAALDLPFELEAVDVAAEEAVDEVYDAVTLEAARGALEQLPPDQRRAIEMAYFEGMTQAEVAQTLGVPVGTVKSRLRLGLVRLRDIMGVRTR